jgi:urease accessory protein
MGSPSARIREEAFLTPPEFAGRRLAWPSAGQIGGARLELSRAGPRSSLSACYQQTPVRVLPPFHFAGEPASLLYLIVPTAGLMDGDGHLLDLVAGPGTQTIVTGQSANRIHPARDSFATQQWQVRVCAGACLVVLPGPAIPFAGCRFYQRARIDLEGDARLVWGDVWLPGRYARGEQSERFRFDCLVQDLEVRRDGVLVFRERFAWRGPWDEETARWHLGPGDATGSLFLAGGAGGLEAASGSSPACAVLPTASGDTCIRWCGAPAEVIRAVVRAALGAAGNWSGGPAAPPWLLESNHLARNHWFSTPPGAGP